AALDVVDAEFVKHADDSDLVGVGEVDAVGLSAVAQRRVEQIEMFLAHAPALLAAPLAAKVFFMVVLLSHSLPTETELRCCGSKPRCEKNSRALSLASTVRCGTPREADNFSTAS